MYTQDFSSTPIILNTIFNPAVKELHFHHCCIKMNQESSIESLKVFWESWLRSLFLFQLFFLMHSRIAGIRKLVGSKTFSGEKEPETSQWQTRRIKAKKKIKNL